MAVNRYTNPTWNQPISMYVPQPFDTLSEVGRQTQHRYDEGKKYPGIMDDLAAKIKAAPYHQDYKDQVIKKYQSEINNLVDEAKGNYGNPDFQYKAQRLIGKFANDQDIQTIQQESKAFDNYQEKYAQDPKNQRDLNFSLPDGQINKGHLIKHGINVVPFAEHIKDAASFTEHTIPNSDAISNITPHGDGFMYVLKNGEKQYIDRNTIESRAKEQVPSYAGTAGGDFRMKKWLSENIPQLGPQLSKLGYEQIVSNLPEEVVNHMNDYLANDIVASGLQKVHHQTKLTQGLHNIPEGIIKAQLEELKPTTRQTEGMNYTPLDDKTKDIEFNKDGSMKLPTTSGLVVRGGHDEFGVYDPNMVSSDGKTGLDKDKYINNLAVIKSIKQEHPELSQLNDKEAVEAYRTGLKSVKNESMPLLGISNQAAKNNAEDLVRNKIGRTFYIQDSKGNTVTGDWDTVKDKLGLSEEEFDKQLKEGVGGIAQGGPSPGAYYAEITDSKDNKRRVLISQDKEIQDIFKTSTAVNSARQTMTPSTVRPFENMPNYEIQVKPSISKDGSVKWSYKEIVKDGSGNVIQENPTTLDDIREVEKEHLKKSGYLGSDITVLKNHTTK